MTTRRHFLVNMLAPFLVTATLLGQNFWDKKDYMQWTDQEISTVTTDSPWAKKQNELTITWITALPVKQAMLKDRMEAGGVLAESAKEIMSAKDTFYAISITGLAVEKSEALTEVSLKIENKPVIKPASGNFQRRGSTVDVMVMFPRAEPITADDKEVEVILKIGTDEIGTKFLLKDMVYNGKLEM